MCPGWVVVCELRSPRQALDLGEVKKGSPLGRFSPGEAWSCGFQACGLQTVGGPSC